MQKTYKNFLILIIASALLPLISCATIATSGVQSFPVITDPAEAVISIYDSSNNKIFEENSPCIIVLSKKDLINSRLIISKYGYKDIELKIGKRVDFCFYGNICLGIIPGIVDIINGNWVEGDINGINVKLKEMKTVKNTYNKQQYILSYNDRMESEYSFMIETISNEYIIAISEIKQ
jgi:hypothetical protein